MPLNPHAEALLKQMEAQGLPPFEEMSVPQARDVALAFRDLEGDPEEVAEIRDVLAPGPAGQLPVRVYIPHGEGPFPLVVYYHGGGWVIGNVEVVDKPCRALANDARCVVASVEYRLSPESKYPAAPEDCYAATKWLAEHAAELRADPDRLVVAGDSAGGNLAAVVALMARDRGGPRIGFQVLLYPVTGAGVDEGFASYRDNADGYLLTTPSMRWFWDHYLASPDQASEPYASPLQAKDLSGLPPALVLCAEFDPLRDEGLAYAERLREAGVPVTSRLFDGLIHGFFWMGGVLDAAREARVLIAEQVEAQVPAAH
jgi:acetyl esterase